MSSPNIDRIPSDLKAHAHWVLWRTEQRDGKPTKVPYSAALTGRAACDRPSTWTTFEQALARFNEGQFDGLGFVFTKQSGFVGVDLDKCLDPNTGQMKPEASTIVERLQSYTERSPSGTGLHVILRGAVPPGGNRKGGIEFYDDRRYFTVTGDHVQTTPGTIEERSEALKLIHAEVFVPSRINGTRAAQPATSPVCLDDAEIIQRASAAKNGHKFARLFAGDTSGYASQSEADLALCQHLCFWTGGDKSQMDRLFRQSGLSRDKWDEKHFSDGRTYGEETIENAITHCREFYAPGTLSAHRQLEASGPEEEIYSEWPVLDATAYHGLIGELVQALAPQTEADPVALLIQAHVAFGNLLNRGPHFLAEADRHTANLFVCLVGETSKGRKGTSWGYVKRVFGEMDTEWSNSRVLPGLSSGEGLIWAVRDPIMKEEPIKENGRHTGEYDTVIVDRGIEDKRLFVVESELGGTLNVLKREGNTLSAVIRQAWDTGDLRTMTRNNPAQATGAHISIVGHITRDELLRLLNTTEAANGFCNRFLWLCVRRSKSLPEGGHLDEAELAPLIQRLNKAVSFARGVGRVVRDEAASEAWRLVYPTLSDGKPGLLGAVISRSEAQVMRLAMLYAIEDMSYVVRREHLRAALALWEYCEQSAQFIFGHRLGDPVADELVTALRTHPGGMTRTDIRDWFGRNRKAYEIDRGLTLLQRQGLAHKRMEPSDGGRPVERWRAGRSTT
jgi:hypothetical protein